MKMLSLKMIRDLRGKKINKPKENRPPVYDRSGVEQSVLNRHAMRNGDL
jgi:hypothetical protein